MLHLVARGRGAGRLRRAAHVSRLAFLACASPASPALWRLWGVVWRRCAGASAVRRLDTRRHIWRFRGSGRCVGSVLFAFGLAVLVLLVSVLQSRGRLVLRCARVVVVSRSGGLICGEPQDLRVLHGERERDRGHRVREL